MSNQARTSRARSRPSAGGGGAHPGFHAVAPGGDHRLVDAVGDPHRATGLAGQRRGDRLHLGVRLAAETAAEIGHHDPHRGNRKRVEIGELGADQERMLAGRPDGELVVARPLGDGGVRFQRVLVDRGEGVLALDDDIRRGEDLRRRRRARTRGGSRRCPGSRWISPRPWKRPGAQVDDVVQMRGIRRQGRVDRDHGRQLFVRDVDERDAPRRRSRGSPRRRRRPARPTKRTRSMARIGRSFRA